MGIYDREYYRREGPSLFGSFADQGLICKWLIGINIVCFILQMVTRTPVPFEEIPFVGSAWRQPFTDALLLNVDKVWQGEVWRLVTYAFLHSTSSPWHIVFNMLFLYWFGRQVEEQLGAREFLAFYLGGVLAAALAYVAATIPGWLTGNALGASGGVMAVLVLAALYHPRQVIYVFLLIPVPIWGFVLFLVVSDAFNLLGGTSGGVATSAHLGGALFGFAYYRLGWRLTGLLPSLSTWKRSRAHPRLRLYREDEEPAARPAAPRPAPPVRAEDEQLEAQMDAILAKIPRVGMEGLTEHERELLLRASEAIKRRRG
jgi:membrane associated rhomboid family serine protease